MFTCFGPKFKPKNALIIGLENAGKTSLLYRTKFDGFSDIIYTEPTIGFNRELITFNDYKVKLTLTDLPGVEGLQSIWPHFITNEVDGLIFVVDANQALTDYDYLLDCKDIFWKTLDNQHELDTCPLIIFLNKMDKAKNTVNKINRIYKNGERYGDDFGVDLEHFDNNGFNISKWFSDEFELDQLSWRSYLVQPCSTKRSNPKVMQGMRWLISKMVSKTQGKDKPFYGENKKDGTVNLSRRGSTHVVTRRHKKYKSKPVVYKREPSVILEQQYYKPENAEIESTVPETEIIPNKYQYIDDRLSQIRLESTYSRLSYQETRRKQLEKDFVSDDQMSFAPKNNNHSRQTKGIKNSRVAQIERGDINSVIRRKCKLHETNFKC